MKLTIENWEQAEHYAGVYAQTTSQLERIEEAFKQFALERKAQVGRERFLPPVIPSEERNLLHPGIVIGFQPVPQAVRIPSDSLSWLAERGNGRFVKQKTVAKDAQVKNYLKAASESAVQEFSENGIVLVEAYDKFYLKLARAQRAVIGS